MIGAVAAIIIGVSVLAVLPGCGFGDEVDVDRVVIVVNTTIDKSGNIYVVGSVPATGPESLVNFLAKYDADGQEL